MSAKIPSQLNNDCKDFFQAVSFASQLGRMVSADTEAPLPRRRKADWPIGYDSAIAFKLAAQRQQPALTVAAEIAAEIAVALPVDRHRWQIHVVSPGLIRFESSEIAIAAGLQQLLQGRDDCTLPPLHLPARSLPADQIFRVQYVHARCCMLLQSAAREGWFTLSTPDIPWLTAAKELRLQHSIEQQAIGSLFDSLDALAANRATGDRLWQRSIELSQNLDAFQAACRIWGEVKTDDLPLAQARLGLAWAGQRLLQVLLNCIDIDAPTAL